MTAELPPSLIAAYEATEYRVLGARAFTLRIGQFSPDLTAVFREHEAQCAAFITAWNPLGEFFATKTNATRQRTLVDEVAAMGLVSFSGVGIDPTGGWEGEESILILALDRVAASALATRFEQNAFVWIGSDAVPQLTFLR